MGKKNLKTLFAVTLLIVLCAICLTACAFGKKPEAQEGDYEIAYFDGEKTQHIKVKKGENYSIAKHLPSKEGMIFIGLYDKEVCGTKFVDKDGNSLQPFSGEKNINLVPRFVYQKYKLSFDYGEAAVTDVKELDVKYFDGFPFLPENISIPSKYYMHFIGWYAKARNSTKEIKVSDNKGEPVTTFEALINDGYADENKISLYAKFEIQKYMVSLYSQNGGELLLQKQVSHGEKIASVASNIWDRGIKILGWATSPNTTTEVDMQKSITSDISLYVARYANSATAKFTDSTRQRITDKNESSNYYDNVQIARLFGRSKQSFIELGYTKVKFTLYVTISEINAGYQEVFLSTTRSGENAVWKKTDIEHGGSIGATTKAKKYEFNFTIDINRYEDNMYILYGAHGNGADDWYRHSVELNIEIFKG